MLHRGDWYHRRGFASDLCTAEWKKLSPEQQADYIQVQSLDDLGEQVRLPHDGHLSALNAAADTSLCSQAGLYQQHNDKVVPQTNLGTISLDSKKVQRMVDNQASRQNHAGAQMYRTFQELAPSMDDLSPHVRMGLAVRLSNQPACLRCLRTSTLLYWN